MTNLMKNAKRCNCGCDVVYDDLYDVSLEGSKGRAYWYGYCKDCGQTYHWCEVYTFESIEDFGENDD